MLKIFGTRFGVLTSKYEKIFWILARYNWSYFLVKPSNGHATGFRVHLFVILFTIKIKLYFTSKIVYLILIPFAFAKFVFFMSAQY